VCARSVSPHLFHLHRKLSYFSNIPARSEEPAFVRELFVFGPIDRSSRSIRHSVIHDWTSFIGYLNRIKSSAQYGNVRRLKSTTGWVAYTRRSASGPTKTVGSVFP
jgi:hypothetical protein